MTLLAYITSVDARPKSPNRPTQRTRPHAAATKAAGKPGLQNPERYAVRVHFEETCKTHPPQFQDLLELHLANSPLANRNLQRSDPNELRELNSLINQLIGKQDDGGTVFGEGNIQANWSNLPLEWLLRISLSCYQPGRVRWIAKVYDIRRIKEYLHCRGSQQNRDQRGDISGCGNKKSTQSFIKQTFTETRSLENEEIKAAIQILLVQTLGSLQVLIQHDLDEFIPNHAVEPYMLLVASDASSETAASLRDKQIRYDILELPDQRASSICSDPTQMLRLLECSDKADTHKQWMPDQSPRVLRCETLTVKEGGTGPTGQPLIGVQGSVSAPPYPSHLLIRAAAFDASGQKQQTPITYRCLSVRPPPYYFGIAVHYGIPYDINRNPADSSFPPAALAPAGIGIQLEAGARLPVYLKRSRWFSAVYGGGALGFHQFNRGVYPCPSRQFTDCQDPLASLRSLPTTSTSTALDLRVAWRVDVVRFWKMSIILPADLGFGAEYLSSTGTPFSKDGWHGLFASRVGLGLSLMAGFSGRLAARYSLVTSMEARLRLGSTYNLTTGNVFRAEAAGVPDSAFTVWVSFLGHVLLRPKGKQI